MFFAKNMTSVNSSFFILLPYRYYYGTDAAKDEVNLTSRDGYFVIVCKSESVNIFLNFFLLYFPFKSTTAEAFLEPSRSSRMKTFVKIVNS